MIATYFGMSKNTWGWPRILTLDFVNDAFADGRRFRILAVIDDYTRENLALVADSSISGSRVSRELDRIIAEPGPPSSIVSDNGTIPRHVQHAPQAFSAGIEKPLGI